MDPVTERESPGKGQNSTPSCVDGSLEGSWAIDTDNAQPTGVTIDPNDVNHLWIVDSRTDAVYQYDSATTRIAGEQSARLMFLLAESNRNPQGIADPSSSAPAGSGVSHWENHGSSAPSDQLHWENPKNELDVNDDGSVTASDALEVINHLSRNESNDIALLALDAFFLDSNADGRVSAADALAVINGMNRLSLASHSDLIDQALGKFDDDDNHDDENKEEDDSELVLDRIVSLRLS